MSRESQALPLLYEVTLTPQSQEHDLRPRRHVVAAEVFDNEGDLSREDALYASVRGLAAEDDTLEDVVYDMRAMRPKEIRAYLRQKRNEQIRRDLEIRVFGVPMREAVWHHMIFLHLIDKA